MLLAANMDVQAAQGGIVYIDEIDKLGGGRVYGVKDMRLGVQHALLKMIEGTVANVPPSGGLQEVGETCIPVDTSNILFICGGAFVGLDEIVARRQGQGAFGFDQPAQARHDESASPLHHVLPEDVEKFGLIPELLGRLPVIATLDDLGVDDLVRILREPKNSLLAQYRKLLKYRHADLEFTDGAVRAIAKVAHERGTGARGLRAVVERVVEGILFRPATLGDLQGDRDDGPRGRARVRQIRPAQPPSAEVSGCTPPCGRRHRMSRRRSGKSPIPILARRFSLFIVTPPYLFLLWIFHPVLAPYSTPGKAAWLLVWWIACNIGGFSISVGLGWPLMRACCDFVYQTRREYWDWCRAGGDPFWDVLPWPIRRRPARGPHGHRRPARSRRLSAGRLPARAAVRQPVPGVRALLRQGLPMTDSE